jgi:glycosyltransferase involved in cell wall biosynthesis
MSNWPSVLIVALSKGYGGAEVRVFDMAQAFNGRCHYAVVTMSGSVLDQRLEKAGLARRPMTLKRSDPRLMLRISQIIKEEGFQVVDAHNPQSQLWGLRAAKKANVPVLISTVHHAYGEVKHLRLLDRLYEQVLKANIRWGCQFTTVSQSIYDYLLRIGVDKSDLRLIHNAIDLEATASHQPDYSVREKLGWGDDTVMVIVVGRLEVQKGHTFMVEAMRLASQKCPQLRCLLVGEGRQRAVLEQQIEALALEEYVHLFGFSNDVPSLLGSSDIFCLPSLHEGLPYALLEASAFKLPFVVTAVDGMAELLTNEQDALLIPPANSAALADALCRLANDPQQRKTLGQASYNLVKQTFSPEQMMNETVAMYQKKLTMKN